MAKTKPAGAVEPQPTFAFVFFKHPDGQWTSQFLRDGEVKLEVETPNTYQFNAAVMEQKLRMAVHE